MILFSFNKQWDTIDIIIGTYSEIIKFNQAIFEDSETATCFIIFEHLNQFMSSLITRVILRWLNNLTIIANSFSKHLFNYL